MPACCVLMQSFVAAESTPSRRPSKHLPNTSGCRQTDPGPRRTLKSPAACSCRLLLPAEGGELPAAPPELLRGPEGEELGLGRVGVLSTGANICRLAVEGLASSIWLVWKLGAAKGLAMLAPLVWGAGRLASMPALRLGRPGPAAGRLGGEEPSQNRLGPPVVGWTGRPACCCHGCAAQGLQQEDLSEQNWQEQLTWGQQHTGLACLGPDGPGNMPLPRLCSPSPWSACSTGCSTTASLVHGRKTRCKRPALRTVA